LEFGDGFVIGGIAHGDLECGTIHFDGENNVFAGDGFGNQFDHGAGNGFVGEVDVVEFVELCEGLHGLIDRAIAQLDENILEFGAGLLLHGPSFFQLVWAEDLVTNKEV